MHLRLPQDLPTNWVEREALREKGQFWTPAWVADAMVRYVTADTNLVLDPATGNGAFFEAIQRLNLPMEFLGFDVDMNVLSQSIYRHSKCTVELRDFIENPPREKFKAIVGNPPYIRHHRLNVNTKNHLRQMATKMMGQQIDGRAGYHVYFLLQALNLLAVGGRLAFILPADVCEGKFSSQLWRWITARFCLDCVVTFAAKATPFPRVDTNAMIFFVRNLPPQTQFFWVEVKEPDTQELTDYVASGFSSQQHKLLNIQTRELQEAVQTGLSRPKQTTHSTFFLKDFAKVMRGIATGSNEFFFLTLEQTKSLNIPAHFFKRAIGRTKDVSSDCLRAEDMVKLEQKNRPTYLLSLNGHEALPTTLIQYLEKGKNQGLPERALIRQRKPWYKMEKRDIPPLLFAYLGRRNTRFIKNEAQVLPLTGFLCVYPIFNDEEFIDALWQVLNHPDTLANLRSVGKSYGSGAIKVEPSQLGNLPIPTHLVTQFRLLREQQPTQLQLF